MNQQPDYVATKLAEIDADIRAVDQEAVELQNKKKALFAMREALLPLSPKEPRVVTQPVAAASAASPVNTGFRNAVRLALREHPKGLKPAELIQLLGRRGELARYTGKVKPQDRVYAELYALKQSKEVAKRYGRYVYAMTEATNGHT